ncbi:Bgt-4718 [Blumeria graminis f. sp. tritici]|uniref:Inheritance of peroxisomes protein 1 n=3 Tax=Blumeria graminis f. sp. tritici TaxID=62690 RepID=A0A656KFN5_BLUGR|nr:hypothetical protein BGT96224_4718 [Blumeria graminis f. sp. tritici 96224]VDB83758.1 Bgt-4718 [Blumeria graminis f. sp. tritici]
MASVSTRSVSRHTSNISPDTFASSTDSQIETLYSLPDARIVEFKPPSPNSSLIRNNDTAIVDAEPGTLSWASKFERTIAVGFLRIYRAPGSVAFLNCQNAVRPILPKSQAWCVDGISKFVLRSPPLFWRIEVPSNSPDELQRIEELKRVLDKILRFDRTPCPFERHFSIELLEPPSTPTRKKPVRNFNEVKERNKKIENAPNIESDHSKINVQRDLRRTPSLSSLPDKFSTTKIKSKTKDPARNLASTIPSVPVQLSEKNLKLHNKAEFDDASMIFGSATLEFHEISYQNKINAELGNEINKICPLLSNNHFEATTDSPTDQYMTSPMYHNSGRSSMVSPFISMIMSPSFKQSNFSSRNITISKDCESEVSSSGSFYSSQSWHSPLDLPSVANSHGSENIAYPYPHDSICGPVGNAISCNDSRSVKAPVSTESWDGSSSDGESHEYSLCSNPKTPTLTDDRSEKSEDDCHEITTPSHSKNAQICHGSPKRIGSKMKRASVSSLSLAGSRKMLQMAHQLPTAIIQKTFGALLSPPTHLCHLMLRIASRIAAGEWRGMLSNYGELVHWDFEDEYGEDEQDEEGTQSLPISGREIKKVVYSNWEVD